MKPTRKRKKRQGDSRLQIQCEHAIQAPSGVTRVLNLIADASDSEIIELNASQYSPLVGCIFRLGKNTTRNGNSIKSQLQLDELIEVCHRRNLSVNSGAHFAACFHRPLIVAAYFGYYSAVRLLLEKGANPNLRDGDDKNVLYATFLNPTGRSNLRECDKRVAETLWAKGAVTCDLGEYRRPGRSSVLCYSNCDSESRSSSYRSVMYLSINNKCLESMKFLVQKGVVITDEDFFRIIKYKKMKRFLSMVASLESVMNYSGKPVLTTEAIQRIGSWNQDIAWSFPPSWKVSIILCKNCGLPEDIFCNNIVPFLSRDWFFTRKQLRKTNFSSFN